MLTPGQSLDLMLYVYAAGYPDLQVPLGRRDVQFAEEIAGHGRVVVLAGVEDLVIVPGTAQCPVDGSELDELWPCSHDADDSHGSRG